MRLFSPVTLALLVCASSWAAENPQLAAARERVKTIEMLVDAGAASRAQLAQAREDLADAEDGVLLDQSLHSRDLTETEAEEMIAAATRRLQRRQQAFDKTKRLVDAGLAIPAGLAPLATALDFARSASRLADEVAALTSQVAAAAQVEAAHASAPDAAASPSPTEQFDGNGRFSPEILARIEDAYQRRFGKSLPISAMGETAVHRALGFDHTGRVDVALNPDQPEGVWLRRYLEENQIPFFAFRQAIPGKSTGAHIHLGPQSTRLARTVSAAVASSPSGASE